MWKCLNLRMKLYSTTQCYRILEKGRLLWFSPTEPVRGKWNLSWVQEEGLSVLGEEEGLAKASTWLAFVGVGWLKVRDLKEMRCTAEWCFLGSINDWRRLGLTLIGYKAEDTGLCLTERKKLPAMIINKNKRMMKLLNCEYISVSQRSSFDYTMLIGLSQQKEGRQFFTFSTRTM